MTVPPPPPLPPPPDDPQGWNATGRLPIPPGIAEPDGTWTIPQPGELGPIDVLSVGFALWRRHWRVLAVLSLLLSGSVLVVQALMDPGPTIRELVEWFRDGASNPLPPASRRAQALGTLRGLILDPILILATLRVLLGGSVGATPPARRAITYGLRRLPSTLWLFVAMGISMVGVGLGAVIVSLALAQASELLAVVFVPLLLYPGLRLWSAALPALVVDDTRGFAALRQSWALTRGRWWSIFAVLLVLGLVVAAGSLLALVASALIPWSGTPGDLTQAIVVAGFDAFTVPVGAGILAALFLDLRARRHRDGAGMVRELIERHDPPTAPT